PEVGGVHPMDDGHARVVTGDVDVDDLMFGVAADDLRLDRPVNAADPEVEPEPVDRGGQAVEYAFCLGDLGRLEIVEHLLQLGTLKAYVGKHHLAQANDAAVGLPRYLAPRTVPLVTLNPGLLHAADEDRRTDLGVRHIHHVDAVLLRQSLAQLQLGLRARGKFQRLAYVEVVVLNESVFLMIGQGGADGVRQIDHVLGAHGDL